MGILRITFLSGALLLTNCDVNNGTPTNTGLPDSDSYELSQSFAKLTFDMPVELTAADDGTNRLFVVEQKGIIRVFQNNDNVSDAPVFLDIQKRVESGGEKGLLGLAFHPLYEGNGYFYVNYTKSSPLETIVSRFKVTSNPNVADAASETILLRFAQPYGNHNGGKIAFGNDGYLYISTGDGGSGGDPKNNSQNKRSLLGKILRIDVNQASGSTNYSIPPDNPFAANTEGHRQEIFAFGLRNAWRFNFDRKTGQLWAGDVGQNRIEEVDVIEKGGNYGWRIMEAEECYSSNNCDMQGLVKPVWSYKQGGDTGRSVTGGYVCRDPDLPELEGKYIYGDYVSGNIWALTHVNKQAVSNVYLTKIMGGLSSFGEDSEHHLFVLSLSAGKIYSIKAKK
jgi:glucose/arabinose dehydrogenase